MVAALEQAWADIRTRHHDLPAAVLVLGAGSIGVPAGSLRLGHFAATRWTRDDDQGERLAEVFIGGEGLARGPADVLGTLLHEAAHAIVHVRGIKDTSRQGRWHNARFKALAEELGIEVTKDPRLGWSPTTLPEVTRDDYAATLAELRRALLLHRSPEAIRAAAAGPTTAPSPVSATAVGGSASPRPSCRPVRSRAACVAAPSSRPTDVGCWRRFGMGQQRGPTRHGRACRRRRVGHVAQTFSGRGDDRTRARRAASRQFPRPVPLDRLTS